MVAGRFVANMYYIYYTYMYVNIVHIIAATPRPSPAGGLRSQTWPIYYARMPTNFQTRRIGLKVDKCVREPSVTTR